MFTSLGRRGRGLPRFLRNLGVEPTLGGLPCQASVPGGLSWGMNMHREEPQGPPTGAEALTLPEFHPIQQVHKPRFLSAPGQPVP